MRWIMGFLAMVRRKLAKPKVGRVEIDGPNFRNAGVSDTATETAIVYGSDGLPLDVTLVWSSSAPGVVSINSATGQWTANAAGSATITVKAGHARDTLGFVVTSPQDVVNEVIITMPASPVTLVETQQAAARAVAKDSNGVTLTGKTVTWASDAPAIATVGPDSGDEIHQTTITAVLSGEANVRATSDGVDSSPLVVLVTDQGDPGSSYPNEPTGMTRICEASFLAKPGGLGFVEANQIAGYWWRQNAFMNAPTNDIHKETNLTIITDATAPQSPSSVLRGRFPAGMTSGNDPFFWIGWSDPAIGGSAASSPHYEELYVSVHMRIPTPDYENEATLTKLWYTPHANRNRYNHSATNMHNPGSFGIGTEYPIVMYIATMKADGTDSGGGAVRRDPNMNLSKKFTCGEWHHIETYVKVNTLTGSEPSPADGICRIWIDGIQTLEYTNIRWRSTLNPLGFTQYRHGSVYGGNNNNTKTRDDFMDFDHIYVSGRGAAVG